MYIAYDRFGKGVYFADMVSKSANYCSTSHDSNIACMLLCEVALGMDIYILNPICTPWTGCDDMRGCCCGYDVMECVLTCCWCITLMLC